MGGNDIPHQYSCLENSRDRGTWWAAVRGITESDMTVGLTYTSSFILFKSPGLASWVGKIPWGRKWQPTPVFLPGESHGQRSLVGYSPWGRKSWT